MTVLAWCGDSITAGSVAGWRRDFPSQVLKLLGPRMSAQFINAGVSGDRADQVLARMPAILAQGPGLAFVMVGTNDSGQGVTLVDYRANIEAIRSAADSAGVPVVFGLVPPATGGPAMPLVRQYNLWLRNWCHHNRIPLADTWAALVDPATGFLQAALAADAVHPNDAGHLAIAAAVADTLRPMLPAPVWPVVSPGGMLPDPLGAGTAGWEFRSGLDAPLTTVTALPGELPAGNWVRITAPAGGVATWGAPLGAETVAWDEGDELLVAAYLRGGVDKVQLLDGSTPVGWIVEASFPTQPGPLLRRVTIPTVAGTLRLGVTAKAGTTVDVGACDVFNLTRLGLTDLEV